MLSRLDKLKHKITKRERGDLTTSIYYLIKELKCLPDILGREFEVEYDKSIWWKPFTWRKIIGIRQKPMSIPSLMVLLKEMETDYKKQEKEMKKSRVKGKRR